MIDAVLELSSRLAALAAEAEKSVVRVGGRRAPASGVVWSADGVIVAAHHSVEWEDEIEVGLPGGGEARAELLGRDPSTDLAVLRTASPGLQPAAWGAGDASLGQVILGVGRPGRSARASLGIVARTAGEWRAPGGGKLDRYVETSLPLQTGLSGSLVAGAVGKAIGLATAGLLRGLAMVVPPATLRRVVKAILAHGHVRRGYLGVATVPVRLRGAGEGRGALLVTAVEPESPAARAGVIVGDALVSLGGAGVSEAGDLMPLLEEERIGDALAATVVRAGETRELSITVGAREGGRRSAP